MRALDISCGNGSYLDRLVKDHPGLEAVGLDMSDLAITQAQAAFPRLSFVRGLAEDLPFENSAFDSVHSSMTFHHYRLPLKVLSETARVLKAGGKFFLTDYFPAFKASQWLANRYGCSEPYHFEKYYRKREIEVMAGDFGLVLAASEKISVWSGRTRLIFFKKTN